MTTGQSIAQKLNEHLACWSADEEAAAAELIEEHLKHEKETKTEEIPMGAAPERMVGGKAGEAPPKPFTLKSEPAPKHTAAPDLCFEALSSVCDMVIGDLTPSARGRLNRALAEIRKASPNVTPAEIRARGVAYARKWPCVTLSPSSLALHWPELAANRASIAPMIEVLAEPVDWREWLPRAYPREVTERGWARTALSLGWLHMPHIWRVKIAREMPRPRH